VNKIYVSLAHSDADVDQTLAIFDDVLATLARG
jgi:glutamate-1-semialdehyde aminotransferase